MSDEKRAEWFDVDFALVTAAEAIMFVAKDMHERPERLAEARERCKPCPLIMMLLDAALKLAPPDYEFPPPGEVPG